MFRLRLAGLLLALPVFAAMAAHVVLAQSGGEGSRKAAKPLPEQTFNSKAMQGSVKLGATFSKEIAQLLSPPDWHGTFKAHYDLRLRYDAGWAPSYQHYMKQVSDCVNKNHTVADQQAAGCLPSDTLALCMDKIYNQCLSRPLRGELEARIPEFVGLAKALNVEASNLTKRIPNALPKYRKLNPR